jgi:hypothetical protein
MKGKCQNGAKCDFYHPKTCKWFKSGECSAADKCLFAHPAPEEPKAKKEPKAKAKPKAKKKKAE